MKTDGRVASYWELRSLLKRWGMKLTKAHLATSADEAVEFAEKIGYPVVMKIESKDILHKSDAGCVFTNVWSADDVIVIYDRIVENAKRYNKDARIDGVVVEEMIRGVELLVGAKRDELFGSVVVFGVGGIMTELLKDVAMRVVPISKEEARAMIDEIKLQKLFEGFRGMPRVDKNKLAALLSKFSKMVHRHEKLVEMDINPLFASGANFIVGDARAVFSR